MTRRVRRLPGPGEAGQRRRASSRRATAIGAVNSINWARVAAQVVYYFKGYFAATRSDGEQVSFAVPSGNFGNIYAGYVARRMGLPVKRLILATNENDVLDEYFRTGPLPRAGARWSRRRSPSMDISKASNFERYVFALAGPAKVDRSSGGSSTPRASSRSAAGRRVRLRPQHARRPHRHHPAGRSRQYGVVIDPHTADGVKVGLEHARRRRAARSASRPRLPAKFAATIREALGREPERPRRLRRPREAAAALRGASNATPRR